MLYIHTLKDLNQKSADIEVTQLVRELKTMHKIPLTTQALYKHLSNYFISKTDLEAMSRALNLIPDTVNQIVALSKTGGPYEAINLKRACQALEEMPIALSNNITYGQAIAEEQQAIVQELTTLLNAIPKLKIDIDKKNHDKKLSPYFEMLLRSKTFVFNFADIINEAHTGRMKSLSDSIDKGFFFHVKLEEHLKGDSKTPALPANQKAALDSIVKNIASIKEGVERAYEHNMRMMTLSIYLYAYVRWLSGK
jgi:hypothetical protein